MTVIDRTIYDIFKRGSKTYFYSTLFFPPDVKARVFSLYSFVRTADDLVDSVPQRVTSSLRSSSPITQPSAASPQENRSSMGSSHSSSGSGSTRPGWTRSSTRWRSTSLSTGTGPSRI